MKTFVFTEEESPKKCALIFRIYLAIFNKNWNKSITEYNYVYDDYDIIDTLGSTSTEGRFTRHYRDELNSTYSIIFCKIEFRAIF